MSVCLVHQWVSVTMTTFLEKNDTKTISESQNQNYFRESKSELFQIVKIRIISENLKSEWLKLEDGSKVSATAAEIAEYVRSYHYLF